MVVLVVVTGCSGYIGTVLTQELLKKGYRVRGTVRSLVDEAKVSHLKSLCPDAPYPLELFAADLLQPGSFQKAFEGCDYVFHTASPVMFSTPKDPQKELVDPAVEGTKNVIREAAKAKTVKRVILTASMATLCGNQVELDPAHVWNESDWNDSATIANPYSYSKTLAEKAAWALAKEEGLDLVTIHPGLVVGPAPMARADVSSLSYVIDILEGKYADGAPPRYTGLVDVRDVAHAHILAMEKSNANGRYICSSRSQGGVFEMSQIIDKNFPGKYKVPKKLLDPTKGPRINGTDNTRITKELGLEYTPLETSVVDTVHSLEKNNLIKK